MTGDMRGHNAVKGKQGFQEVVKDEPALTYLEGCESTATVLTAIASNVRVLNPDAQNIVVEWDHDSNTYRPSHLLDGNENHLGDMRDFADSNDPGVVRATEAVEHAVSHLDVTGHWQRYTHELDHSNEHERLVLDLDGPDSPRAHVRLAATERQTLASIADQTRDAVPSATSMFIEWDEDDRCYVVAGIFGANENYICDLEDLYDSDDDKQEVAENIREAVMDLTEDGPFWDEPAVEEGMVDGFTLHLDKVAR